MMAEADLLEKVIYAVRQAEDKVMDIYQTDFEVHKKRDESPVTLADEVSERLLLDHLDGPDYGYLAEESGFKNSPTDRYWIIDPLDGTRDFIQGTGEFAVMVGLIRDGVPQLGVVGAPALDKLWLARRGTGSYLVKNGRRNPIKVSDRAALTDYRLIVSRNHFQPVHREVAERLGVTAVDRVGSVGVKYATVAEGAAELCIYTSNYLGPWDCCAPQLILQEAGGEVFDRYGETIEYDPPEKTVADGFIGSNGKNRELILDSVQTSVSNLEGEG